MISRPGRLRPFSPLPPPSGILGSRCIDRKHVTRKALLIGCTYGLEQFASRKDDQMKGTHVDVDKFRDLLIGTMYFDKDDIVIMKDALETSPYLWPTKANIEREIHRFVQGASAGDIHFIFYGGHGYQKFNANSTEADKKDEHVVPCDAVGPNGFIEGAMIVDDVLKNILVMPLAAVGAKLTAVFDCCHSGTVLDLSHYRCNDCTSWTMIFCRLYRFIASDVSVNLNLLRPRTVERFIAASHLDPPIEDCRGFCLISDRRGPGYVVCISACRDEEMAWGGAKGGALSRAIMSALQTDPEPTLKELSISINATVQVNSRKVTERRKREQNPSKVVQHPQFSSLCPLVSRTSAGSQCSL
ncbi:peptidase C14 [Guyanagaster necrorhizus]|uniref:Peptidase C14 n=1 Tax=Guyanagaster necrorhizus TaxID=856835 RepID=A0A9P8ART6_9AGAR|nr:peptidase C14 [Guyanagaster necrorhizus MCA 3950]KAG7445549.1 peptidase C14 [Guyanagaster necrorhizus MCA 3950]